MTSKETQVRIKGRMLTLAVDGLGPLEISSIAGQVEKKMNDIEEATNIPDNSKLALMAAFSFATELYNLKQRSVDSSEADSKKIDELSARLENALNKELF